MSIFSRKRTWCVLVGFALSLSACGKGSGDPPATDNTTFVSLNPCLDAILVEVADPDQILALSHYSSDPSASSMDPETAKAFGLTGGTVEEILALEPDIVLASTFMPPATRSALDQMGLRVEAFGSPVSVEESLEQVERVSALVGSGARADALVEAMQTLRQSKAGSSGPSVLLWQPGEIVPGGQTLIAQLLAEAGFSSHAEALGLGQADRITLEQVLANPPDLLLVAGSSRGQEHPGLDALEGVAIETFDQRLLYCGGPSIVKVRERLADIRRDFEGRGL